MIQFFQKSKTLKSYVLVLPRVLKKMYGKRKQYSQPQIIEAICLSNLNQNYIEYAFAIFMSKNSYNALNLKGLKDYQKLRKELARKFFKGDENFNIHDIFSISKFHLRKKVKDTFHPDNVSMATMGDPVQDHFDDD